MIYEIHDMILMTWHVDKYMFYMMTHMRVSPWFYGFSPMFYGDGYVAMKPHGRTYGEAA